MHSLAYNMTDPLNHDSLQVMNSNIALCHLILDFQRNIINLVNFNNT